jgi:hypothetical protein
MLIIILAIVIALVAWSLHLMQEAVDHHEFSLMLAGTLVAFSAAALLAVYFLMGNYIGYVTRLDRLPANASAVEYRIFSLQSDRSDNWMLSSSLQTAVPFDR